MAIDIGRGVQRIYIVLSVVWIVFFLILANNMLPPHSKVSKTKTRYWIESSTDCYRRLKNLQYGRDLKYDWLMNFPITKFEVIKSNNTNAIIYGQSSKELDLQYFEKAIVYHYIRKYGLGSVRCPHISADSLHENRILQELEIANYRNDYSDIVFNADL